MWDYIVLGQIPGTSFRLGFVSYLTLFDIGLVLYYLKKFHPGILQKWAKKLKKYGIKLYKSTVRKLKPYKKRAIKQLIHIRNDILGPKLKFLK